MVVVHISKTIFSADLEISFKSYIDSKEEKYLATEKSALPLSFEKQFEISIMYSEESCLNHKNNFFPLLHGFNHFL